MTTFASAAFLVCTLLGTEPIGAGDHVRTLSVDQVERIYRVHVPPKYDARQSMPVVIALHGAAMNGQMMEWFSGLSETADKSGFIVVYPNGTGKDPLLTWNAGWFNGKINRSDDVKFIRELLNDLCEVLQVDQKRIYACGMSNGGMMCYRLAAELSDRIAAIAPVAGTIALEESRPARPVSVMHFHGTQDEIVPYVSQPGRFVGLMKIRGVEESINIWVNLNGCSANAAVDVLTHPEDELKVTRTAYQRGHADSEVVLISIEGGGHTWPGEPAPFAFLGKSTRNISANELMWEFFQKHRLK